MSLYTGDSPNVKISSGSNNPNGANIGNAGDIYFRNNNQVGEIWQKSGGGNTGWVLIGIGGDTVTSFAVNGNDTTTVIIAALVGKTLLTLTTGGINRNFNPAVSPLDATFTSATGTLVFASAIASDDIISGTYK